MSIRQLNLRKTRSVIIVLSLSTLLLSAIPVSAQNVSDRIYSFLELEMKLREHPAIEAYAFSAKADRFRAEGAMGLPDPTVSMGLSNFPILSPSVTEYLPTHKYIGFSQRLPNKAKRKANSLTSLRRADSRDLQGDMRFAELRSQLLGLLIERDSIDSLRDIMRQRDMKYQELYDITEIEMSSGRTSLVRLTEVETRRIDIQQTLSDLAAQEADLSAQFIDLVGVVPKTERPDILLKPWNGQALSFYSVKVADAFVSIQDAAVQKAEVDFKPDLGINFTYQQRESGQGAPRSNFDGDDWVTGGVTLTVPIWQDKRQKPLLKGAKLDRSAAQALRMATARKALSDWKRYEAQRKSAVSTLDILNSKVISIERQIASHLNAYESGSGDYTPILEGELAILTLQEKIIGQKTRRDTATLKMNSLIGDKS